ncbi:MAG: chemotaxis protein CheA, partial [Thermoanaerobaculia bacterium]
VDLMRESVVTATPGHDAIPPAVLELIDSLTTGGDSSAEIAAATITTSDPQQTARTGSVRVATARLDRALDLTGEISIARGRLRQLIDLRHPLHEISEACGDVERLSNDLQELVMKLRMVPVGPFFRQYTRSVRDVATAHQKKARLALEGEDVEVDLAVIEHLRNPLTHMIRNAVDHGIESPEVRRDHGKTEEGTITLTAHRDGGTIVIRLSDDGAGLNRRRIAARARQLGLLGETEKLPDQELFRFIFAPGFSTAETVTDMSGRGLGMDVVRRNVEALHGTVNVESHEGTAFTLRLPLTVAIIDGFVVTSGREYYVVPLDAVTECIAYRAQDTESDEDTFGIVNLRGEPVPYVRLRRFFGLDAIPVRNECLVVITSEGRRAALMVDSLIGERQLVIKPLGKMFQGIRGLAGSAVLGNGRVAIVLDVAALLDRCVAAVRKDSPAQSLSASGEVRDAH